MRHVLGAAVLGLVIVACSGSSSDVGDPRPQCVVGSTVGCNCADGTRGTAACIEPGRPDACTCNGTPWTPPGNEDAGSDSGPSCEKKQWWMDVDGDGYGSGVPREACERLEGFVPGGDTDCAPEDGRAHPGQTAFFDTPITGPLLNGHQRFDFDCNKLAELAPASIPATSAVCMVTPCVPGYWVGQPPGCGEDGSWDLTCANATTVDCQATYMGAAKPLRAQRRQGCR